MSTLLDVVSWTALLLGAALAVIGAIGMLRLPDFFSRVHAAGIIDTLAAMLIVLGLLAQSEHWQVAVKLLLLLVFVLITSPTATHALARAALHAGYQPPLDKEDAPSKP